MMKKVYKCDYCEECFANEAEAMDHEDRCGRNPKNQIKDKLVFRLSMLFHSLPTIIACALHEVAADELDYLYRETNRADSHNCCFTIKEQQGKMLYAISRAMDVTRKHNGRKSSTYNDVARENPELLKAMVDTLSRKAWNER
ncbi:MAG: hypothetical protein IJW45_08325 [Oscillospiraceae bacterium]|nr:hypothetical protein [Oscillospiraceae bacterium]